MLIVSKMNDYYDVGMKNGIDKTVVYKRDTTPVFKVFPYADPNISGSWQPAVIGFCGKFYPFVYFTAQGNTGQIIWDVEEAVKTLPKSKYGCLWDQSRLESEANIRKHFERKYPDLERLFHEHRVPVFGFNPAPIRTYSWGSKDPYKSLVLNPNLKSLKFFKVMDPITAYQNIYMFLSGVLGAPPKPTKPIDDKVMAASKGHDGEFSFKKLPGMKRGKKQWR